MEHDRNDEGSDPEKYFLGVFYFNRADKRLLPPKRFPFLGWTVNFANPYSILLMAGLIVVSVFLFKLL